MIKKLGGKFVVPSETTGRRFGTYDTLAEAERRLRQIEFFERAAKISCRPAPPRRRAG